MLYLESTLRETQSQSLIATNTSDLLKLEIDKLKQYSRRACLVISGVELPRNKTSEKAEETETKVQELSSRELGVNEDDFDYELDKAHRLPINPTESTRRNSPPNIICKFRTHHFREQLYSQKKKIHRATSRKINFHVSLTKHRSNLLKETNNYIKNDECIKFCFPDSNGNLKVKFADNHNVSFDTFQLFLTVLERNLGSDENAYEGDNNAEKTAEVEQ